MDVATALAALLMVVAANSTPWLMGRLCGEWLVYPLDCKMRWHDGVRLFGSHKTWRGVIAAIIACGLTSTLLGLGLTLGMKFGALAMTGDALSSGIKRRLRLPPGTEVLGLDQLPEVLLPLWVSNGALHLNSLEMIVVAVAFLSLDAATSRLRHKA